MKKLDILAVGVHPDDVELGCGGTILRQVALGYQVGILDLTKGELGSRGSGEIRLLEAKAAADVLGVEIRENLGFRDGFFTNDEQHQLEIIKILRKYRPDVVLTNVLDDRHPDHGRAGKLTADACFLSGLVKIETALNGDEQKPWRPKQVYQYIQAYHHQPEFVVDISEYMDQKMEAVLAYRSQFFNPDSDEPDTFISSPEFLEMVRSRCIEYGTIAGFKYAEGFLAARYPGVSDIMLLS